MKIAGDLSGEYGCEGGVRSHTRAQLPSQLRCCVLAYCEAESHEGMSIPKRVLTKQLQAAI